MTQSSRGRALVKTFARRFAGGCAGLVATVSVLGTLATASVTAACSNSESRCDTSLSACANTASYKRNIDVTSDEIPTLQISFCRNADCWALTPVLQADGTYICSSSPDGATCGITQDEDSGYIISITTTGSLDVTTSSDTFSVTITVAGSDTPLVSLSKVEDWTPVYSNGTDCPASCETATLE